METESNEVWKDVKGFEGFYKVSNLGRVFRLERKRIVSRANGDTRFAKVKECFVSGHTRPDKYVVMTLNLHAKQTKIYLHRIVADAFIDNPKNKNTVNHIDGNPSNNVVSNLEWCTYSENHIHAIKVLNRKPSKGNLGNTGIRSKKSIRVQCFLDGKLVNEYHGMRCAERLTGISNSKISEACRDESKKAGIYNWKKTI